MASPNSTSTAQALATLSEHLHLNFRPSLRRRLPSMRAISRELGISHHALSRAAGLLVERGVLVREGSRFFLARSPRETGGSEVIHILSQVAGFEHWLREPPHAGRMDFKSHFLPDPSRGLGLCVEILEGGHGPCGGLIVWPTSTVPDALIARYLERDMPVVACSAPSVCTSVQIDRFRVGITMLRHLYQIGHRNVATLALPARNRRRREQVAAFEYLARYPVEPDLKVEVAVSPGETPQDIAGSIDDLLESFPTATALVVPTSKCYHPALEVLTRRGYNMPGEFVLAVVDVDQPPPVEAEIITMEKTDREILNVAVTLLCEAMDSIQRFGVMPRHREVYVAAEVRTKPGDEKPTGNMPGTPISHSAGGQEFVHVATLAGSIWDQSRDKRVAAARRCNQEHHQHAVNRPTSDFENIDLRPHFNRCFRHAKGWMGKLKLQLPAGLLYAHGVPYEIAGADHGVDPCVVMLPSIHAQKGAAGKLPRKIEIPIRRRVKAVYFLQACGYCSSPTALATYKMIGKDGTACGEIPLLPEIAGPAGNHAAETVGSPSNIVDWYPRGNAWRNLTDPSAKTYVITEDGDPLPYERYLTSIQWTPHQPTVFLEKIQITSDPTREETLGLLALTLLTASRQE